MKIWKLETSNSGNDEMLFGSRESCLADALNRHEIDELPDGWSLDEYDIATWLSDNARAIAEHLWAPHIGSGWNAWVYVQDGEIKCSYNTQQTAPRPEQADDFFITSVWTEIDDEGSPFDDEYTEVDYIADYILQGSLDPVED